MPQPGLLEKLESGSLGREACHSITTILGEETLILAYTPATAGSASRGLMTLASGLDMDLPAGHDLHQMRESGLSGDELGVPAEVNFPLPPSSSNSLSSSSISSESTLFLSDNDPLVGMSAAPCLSEISLEDQLNFQGELCTDDDQARHLAAEKFAHFAEAARVIALLEDSHWQQPKEAPLEDICRQIVSDVHNVQRTLQEQPLRPSFIESCQGLENAANEVEIGRGQEQLPDLNSGVRDSLRAAKKPSTLRRVLQCPLRLLRSARLQVPVDLESVSPRTSKDAFAKASKVLKGCPRIGYSTKVKLEAYFHQATQGPVSGPRPHHHPRETEKWDAWAKLGDMDKQTAKKMYFTLVESLLPGWNDPKP
eukprot:TRINITY_DN4499_c0_g1_i3.p1 TRINITY_DN4499_c0_g1~~TRINITY_DN4499_c0_g1_i3.p1  ORF type:complete len:367 (+),score=66.62 TRINITY_DN4499_c0_g1_i3:77-1177(+)